MKLRITQVSLSFFLTILNKQGFKNLNPCFEKMKKVGNTKKPFIKGFSVRRCRDCLNNGARGRNENINYLILLKIANHCKQWILIY